MYDTAVYHPATYLKLATHGPSRSSCYLDDTINFMVLQVILLPNNQFQAAVMVVILVLQSSMLRFLYTQVRPKDSIAVACQVTR